MQLRFWGTRGSLPKPGPNTLKFGGNTSCLEVRTDAGTLIIVDCGSGLHNLGQSLGAERIKGGHILISHTHWDHIQGIPFFAPFFDKTQRWHIYAPRGFGQSMQETLAGQMQYSYFPVRLDQMGAEIRFHELTEGEFQIDDVRIATHYMNHTALTLGFRLEADGASFVYATDHEPYARALASGNGKFTGRDRRHAEFLADADLVIHDAQFTAEEYPSRAGWGHSTFEYATAAAREAGVKRLALTHHDPLRSDAALECLIAKAQSAAADAGIELFGAAEGQSIAFERRTNRQHPRRTDSPLIAAPLALLEPTIVIALRDQQKAAMIREVARFDDIAVIDASNAEEAITKSHSAITSVMVLDAQDRTTIESARVGQRIRGNEPVIYVAESEGAATPGAVEAETDDYLIGAFSPAYARTVIRAALMRTARRWQRPPVACDEALRLQTLHALGILDTAPEDRFDRITRLAASVFDVPTALISLVDRDRQWFKSAQGLDAKETSRETSFCAHAVVAKKPLVVVDTFHDARFAENPLVTGAPHIRFYAGAPIFSGAHCIGTVCVLDSRPREVTEESLQLLRDLAALAEAEIARK